MWNRADLRGLNAIGGQLGEYGFGARLGGCIPIDPANESKLVCYLHRDILQIAPASTV
jgi:hypothetical protein